jgi:hypothetical protein
VKNTGDSIVDELEKLQWAVVLDGKTVPLLSLPPGALAEIQQATGVRWGLALLEPLARLDVAAMLVAAACRKLGIDERTFDDLPDLVRLFVQLPSDMPPVDQGEGSGPDPTNASWTAG